MEIKSATRLAMKNRSELEKVEKCSCYYCCQTYPVSEIVNWTDESKTAICPKCSIDSVVPGVVDVEVLKKAHEYWFIPKPKA